MPNTETSQNINGVQLKDQGSDLAAPSAGYTKLYAKSGAAYLRTNSAVKVIGAVATVNAYTQTYSTAARTVNAYTADNESTAYTGAADSEAKLTDLNALRVAYENLRASHDNLLQVVTALIDDLQSAGLIS